MHKKAILLILDGWGHGQDDSVSAIAQADTPFMDELYNTYPNAELTTFGMQVGLPEGQMGNSEVGHLNIGAGRIVYQEFTRINKAIEDGDLAKNPVLIGLLKKAVQQNRKLHFIGLVSDGGVHSHINHLKALCDIAAENGVKQAYIHAFLDGRDTDPKSGIGYIEDLQHHIQDLPVELSTIIGRYYAMDRDKRWERTARAYHLLVNGKADFIAEEAGAILKERYEAGTTDEFMEAIYLTKEGQEKGLIGDGDVVINFNFRTDRPRQITNVLTQEDLPEYDMKSLDIDYASMTLYDEDFKNMHVLFTKDNLEFTIGEILSGKGLKQIRIAETEKYPHVTFFFSGGRETEFEGEKRILIPSPKVPTYDLKPEMSAIGIKEAIIEEIARNQPDFICLNFANTDMVGHTGVFEAAMKAAETVDQCVKEIVGTCLKHEYEIVIIADHGNSDYMVNPDGSPHTAHTMNPVPIIYLSKNAENKHVKKGKLADIAPTILSLMGLEIPEQMTGEVLVYEA